MCASTMCPLSSSTRKRAFASASVTRPSTSITPSFFAMPPQSLASGTPGPSSAFLIPQAVLTARRVTVRWSMRVTPRRIVGLAARPGRAGRGVGTTGQHDLRGGRRARSTPDGSAYTRRRVRARVQAMTPVTSHPWSAPGPGPRAGRSAGVGERVRGCRDTAQRELRGPVVVLELPVARALDQHRLDGQAHAGPHPRPAGPGAVVHHVGRLMHRGADAVAAEALEVGEGLPRLLGDEVLDRGADLAHPLR